MDEVKVSVILTSYNHANYIAEAIQSALDQTFTDFELLIVDDGSSDNSREIIKTFDDPRIKFLLHEENRGPRIILTEAVNAARGKYIAIHHSDDAWELDKLEQQVDFLDAHEEYAACFTRVKFIDEKSQPNELADNDFYKKVFEQENRTRAEWLKYFFCNANCLCHPSLMIRREIYAKYNLLDFFGLWQLPDYFMWIKLCFHENFYILPEKLTKFRLRRKTQDNMSASTFDKRIRVETEMFLVMNNFVDGFKDLKFFLETFPDAKKFVVDGEINIKFAFAQICFENVRSPFAEIFQLIGLTIIKNLLSDEETAAQIKRLYNYDEKIFLKDSGRHDVFHLAQKMEMLHSEIFLSDGVGDFNLAAEKFIYVESNGDFFCKAEFFSNKPIQFLRFDPDDKFLSVKLESAKINGVEQKTFGSNAVGIVRGFYRFLTADPQFIFEVDNLSGKIIFEIRGRREQNYLSVLSREITSTADENKNLRRHNSELERQNENLAAQIKDLRKTIETLMESNSWKMTEPLRKIGGWVRNSNPDKALEIARSVYKAIPVDEEKKTDWKNKFYKNFAPLLKNTRRYQNWAYTQNNAENYLTCDESRRLHFFTGELDKQPGKIAIHAHIFYLDLLEEIANYFSNMPYKFDALISIVDSSAEKKVRAAFEKISNVKKCVVRVVPNRGRDVAPFIIGFGDLLPNYDFIAHVHSKKSFYTGSEQKKWRHYLFDALLGDSARIKKIFMAFDENKEVGLIYPAPSENIPYPAFTWLSNREAGYYLLSRIGVSASKTDYFDFPAGTMFWARTSALRKFLQSGLTIEDFPEERGQNDGTVAHAFERSVALATLSEGMCFYEFNPANDSYTINIGGKNLWQYYRRNESDIQWILKSDDVISFDIFDTLLMRYVAKPNLVNDLIALKVEKILGQKFDFKKYRLQAEATAREKFSHDVTLDEIYKIFSELTNFDEKTCKKIRELEVSTEIDLILPRVEIVRWLKKAVSAGKKIWLISDMYLQTADLKKILDKCEITGYEKLLISCETGLRKDTGAIWDSLAGKNLIHIGDNELSDYQMPTDRNFNTFHIMSSINLFSQISFGKKFLEQVSMPMSPFAGMLAGMVLAKKFNNPFMLKNCGEGGGNFQIKDFRELGYIFYGVPLLTFMLWLIRKTSEENIQRILFLARDGYFLQPLYKFVVKFLNLSEIPNDYFYSSRRAVTVASIHEISNAYELLQLIFSGTVKKFFDVRFGISIEDDKEISLPNAFDVKSVKKIMDEHGKEILSQAEHERKNYERYISTLGGNFENTGVVDMGYAGTIQYYLQRILGKNLKGYYFATNANNRFGKDSAELLRGCFSENDVYDTTESAIYKYHLLFESILTSPDAQLNHFDEEGNPVFGNPEPGQTHIEDIREVHEGIKDFCRDVLEHFGEYILKVPTDLNFVDVWVRSFVLSEGIVSEDIKKIFAFDDKYCNTFNGNALDFYLKGSNGIVISFRESDNKTTKKAGNI